MSSSSTKELPSRASLRGARRVLVKAGTAIVTNEDGHPSLTRLGALVEQICELHRRGIQVIFVSSGAVGMGKRLLKRQTRMNNMSLMELHQQIDILHDSVGEEGTRKDSIDGTGGVADGSNLLLSSSPPSTAGVIERSPSLVNFLERSGRPSTAAERKKTYDSACAAAGQFEMMNLYSSLFNQYDVSASQLLLTQADFQDETRLKNLHFAIERLMSCGIVPIINENDAVSANLGYLASDVFSDNDSLAGLCARHFNAEVCVLLTDVDGVYDRPPNDEGATMLSFYHSGIPEVGIGAKSARGRGGMQAKIDAAVMAVKPGSSCRACLIASGVDLDIIRSIFLTPSNSSKGTLFATPGSRLEQQAKKELEMTQKQESMTSVSEEARQMAMKARTEARKLQALPYKERQQILNAVADALLQNKNTLLEANAHDLKVAMEQNTEDVLVKRLKLTDAKLSTLASGIQQIASQPDPIGVVKCRRELSEGLILSQVTVPIGVLMIIFESRPDSMPQIASLALASSNGLLLKGGKEATKSNAALHKVIGDAIEQGSNGKIKRDIIGLVTSRGQVADMLHLDDVIDLVIPRGSNPLVSYIKSNTKIPVLGHADGVCHVYVDVSATDSNMVSRIVVDAKTDYPSACNAMETLLLHEGTLENGVASAVLMALRKAGVKCLGGPRAMTTGLCDVPALELKCEYGNLTCMVEVVSSMDDAIDWIHKYGSSHTEAIICDPKVVDTIGETFVQRVDAACVFVNASTRFADGFRFGLGAEVGISTGRIHSRGPVGVEGLLTTKWQLRSANATGDYVSEFAGDTPSKTYTHKELL